MRIAVDAVLLNEHNLTIDVHKLFLLISVLYPKHQFIFLTGKDFRSLDTLPDNASYYTVATRPASAVSHYLYYNFSLPKALKKINADVFIGSNGVVSLSTSIPQILIVDSLIYDSKDPGFPKAYNLFRKIFTQKFFKKAKAITIFSLAEKRQLTKQYKINEEKASVITPFIKESVQPVEWQQREEIKESYSKGCEYFVFTENPYLPSNLITVLKAYSIFKKWQKSGMKLLLLTQTDAQFEVQKEKIDTYRHKDELIIIDDRSSEVWQKIIAAAYAIILQPKHEGYQKGTLEAMNAEVPLLSSDTETMKELLGDTALYAKADNPQDIANQMKIIYKDEQLRSRLIRGAKERTADFTIEKAASLLMQLIESTGSP